MSEAPKIKLPTSADLQNLSKDERLQQAAQASSAAASAQGLMASLREKAAAFTDPKKREQLMTEAFNQETKAKGLSKKARVLKSGTFQGGIGGAGIGAATGAGLGTIVGTVVGTAATIPTSLVGGVVGMGTGAFHGPWIKMGMPGSGQANGEGGAAAEGGGEQESMVQVPQEAIDSGAVQVDEKTGQVTASDPEFMEKLKIKAAADEEVKKAAEEKKEGQTGEKRKPKKLEIRSKQQTSGASPQGQQGQAKKKPPKLGPSKAKAAA